MINYKEIIEQLDTEKIKRLLEQLEIPYQEKDNYLIMPTVCHNSEIDEASWKLYYYKNSHIFQCYTSCESQSIFIFLKNFYETRQISYDWYNDIYRVILDCSNYKKDFNSIKKYQSIKDKYEKKETPTLQTYPKEVLDCFTKTYPFEWLKEGITKKAMDKFNILYSIQQNKIIIPHYDINNNLVGIRGRALNEWEVENLGKYMPIRIENKWYSHPLSLNLYGLNQTKEAIKKEGYCIIFEAEKSVLLNEGFNMPNCSVAVCGSQLNKFALKILLKECKPKEIIIAFDKEEKEGSYKYFNKLNTICKKYNNYCNFSFIYDRYNLLDLKDAPVDCGEEIFKRLLKRRVKVK